MSVVFVAPNGDYGKASKDGFSSTYKLEYTEAELNAKEEARVAKEKRNTPPEGITYKKSMFAIRPSLKKEVRSGDSFEVVVDYLALCLLLRKQEYFLTHLVLHHLKIDLFFCFFYILTLYN